MRPVQQQRVAADPERPVAIRQHSVGIEGWYAVARTEAAQVRRPYLTECAGSLRRIGLSGPNRSVVVLGHRQRDAPRAGGVIGERMPLPPAQGADGADPHAPVARRPQAKHLRVRQTLSVARSPPHEVDTIELHDSVGSADPHVAVRRLDDCRWRAVERAVLHPPGAMGVLGDVTRGIQCPACRRRQPQDYEHGQEPSQHNELR